MPNNNGKKKNNTFLIVSILVLCVAILVPATLAWFTDQTDRESTISFGMIKIDDKSGYNGTQTVNAQPNQPFAGEEDCSVALATGSQPVFIRAKITASFEDVTTAQPMEAEDGSTVQVPASDINAAMAVFVNSLNTLLTNKIHTTISDGYAWTAHTDGYYYLVESGVGAAGIPLKVDSTAVTYIFIEKADMVIPKELTNPSVVVEKGDGSTIRVKNLQYDQEIDITLIFEGVQAENLASEPGAEHPYNPDSPTVETIAQFFDPNAAPNQTLPTT